MPSYAVVTFGCQMNMHDSQRIAEVLGAAGYTAAEPEAADLVLLNTCSVREKAEQKLRSEVGRLGVLKRRRPNLVIGVAGCVAQQEGEQLIRRLPQIDLVVGPDNIAELPSLLQEVETGAPPQVRTRFDYEAPRFLTAQPALHGRPPTAFVTTMKGCDERCTFCIVPHTRGSERYRASSEIVEEVARWVDAGAREVTLLGQTVDSYRDPEGALPRAPLAGEGVRRWGQRRMQPDDETEFPALLRELAQRVPHLCRLRYTSPHPRHLTPALVQAHVDLPVLAKHVHMPVQSGDDRVLKRMGRRYTRAEYLERTQLLQQAVPGLTLSTDVIVGFPGETREQFRNTLSLIEELGFVGVFAFKYSPRPFTPALKLVDDVDEAEKSDRLSELLELSERIRQAHLRNLVGTRQQVLVEGRSKSGAYTGRTERNEIVHFGCQNDPTGEIVEVIVERSLKHSLVASMTDAERFLPYEAAIRGRTPQTGPSTEMEAGQGTARRASPRVLPVIGGG